MTLGVLLLLLLVPIVAFAGWQGSTPTTPDPPRWCSETQQSLNVVVVTCPPYNARGDGSTNDSPAIDAAVAAGAGGQIFFPAGTYLYNGNMKLPSRTTLAGAGRGATTLKLAPGIAPGTKLIRNADRTNGGTHIAIRDMTLDGNRAQNSAVGGLTAVEFTKSSFSTFTNLRLTGWTQHGFDFSVENSDNLWLGNEIDDYGTGAVGFGIVVLSDGHRNRIIGNVVVSTRPNVGIAIDDQSGKTGGVPCTGNVISGNVVRGMDYGYLIAGSSQNIVAHNHAVGITNFGVHVSPSTDAANDAIGNVIEGNTIDLAAGANAEGILVAGTGNRVRGNTIHRGRDGIVVSDTPAVGLTTANTLITGNFVTTTKRYGIHVTGGVRTTIEQNQITGVADQGIRVDTTGAQGNVRHLALRGNTLDGVQNDGIAIVSGASIGIGQVVVANNTIVDASLSSTGTRDAVLISKGPAALDQVTVSGTRSIATTRTAPARLVELVSGPTNVDVWDNHAWGWTPGAASDRASGNPVVQHVSATAALDFAAWSGADCQTLTMTVNGAVDGDVVALGLPNGLASVAGVVWDGWVSAGNTVSVRGCKITAGRSADPAAATVRASVFKYR